MKLQSPLATSLWSSEDRVTRDEVDPTNDDKGEEGQRQGGLTSCSVLPSPAWKRLKSFDETRQCLNVKLAPERVSPAGGVAAG